MKIKSNKIYSFIFGSIIISIVFWNRFIRIRLPRELLPVEYLDTRTLIVISLTIMFFSLTLYYILRLLKIIPKEDSFTSRIIDKLFTYSWISNTYSFIEEHILNGPANLFEVTYNKLHEYKWFMPISDLINYSLKTFVFNWYNPYIILQEIDFIVYFITMVLSKMIPLSIFLVEVIIYNELNYFYKSLILLAIPLITNLFFYIIDYWARTCIDVLHRWYVFERNPDDSTVTMTKKTLTDPEDMDARAASGSGEVLAQSWWMYQLMYNATYRFRAEKEKYKYYLNIIYYGLYFIGFLYYLYILIGHILFVIFI